MRYFMLENGKISNKQMILIFVICRLMLTMAYLPYVNSPPWNQDLWISAILSFPLHIILILPVYALAMRFSKLSLIQSIEVILGPCGKILGAMYVWFFLHRTSIILRELGEFLTAVPYPETPIIVFIAVTALFAAYAVYQGLETICTLGEIIAPVILDSVVLVFVMIAKDLDLSNLQPVLEDGLAPVLYGAFVIAARTTLGLFLWILIPFINESGKIRNSLLIIFLIFALHLSPSAIVTIGVFGLEQAKSLDFPFFHVVRMISIGDFLERIDALFVGFWVIGMFIDISTHYYLAVLTGADLLKLKDYRPIVLAMGTVMVSLSMFLADSMVDLNEFLSYKTLTWYNLLFTFAIPLLLLLVAVVGKKRVDY
jgi:spore germination protein KB